MYVFKTSQFGFTDEELHLMQSGSAYKKIQFKEVSSIDIKKGAAAKYQIRLMVLALLLIGLTMFVIFSGLFTYFPGKDAGEYLSVKGHGAMVAVLLFVLSLVIWSIYQVVVNRLTLVVEMADGTKEKLRLKPIKDTNKLIHFIEFLLSRFDSSKLHFDEAGFR